MINNDSSDDYDDDDDDRGRIQEKDEKRARIPSPASVSVAGRQTSSHIQNVCVQTKLQTKLACKVQKVFIFRRGGKFSPGGLPLFISFSTGNFWIRPAPG